jgi:glycosyltransferase involved in cell wall biosynthesis
VPVTILAPSEPGSGMHKRSDLPVELCWGREVFGIHDHLLPVAKRYELDLLHVQHEFGLFRNPEAFRRLLLAARKAGLKLAVTVHTVFPYPSQWPGFFTELRALVDLVIVHTRQAQAVLAALPGEGLVRCLPHGSPFPQLDGDRATGQDLLRVPTRLRRNDLVWGLCFGFVGPNKNLDATIDAYRQLRAYNIAPKLRLIICGEGCGYYADETLNALVAHTGYGHDVLRYSRFVRPDEVKDIVAACDFGILNETNGTVLSASGQVHLLAAHGLPLAVADVPKHTEAVQAGAVPFQIATDGVTKATPSLLNALAGLYRSPTLRRSVTNGLRQMAERTAWSRLAEAYETLYRKLLEG